MVDSNEKEDQRSSFEGVKRARERACVKRDREREREERMGVKNKISFREQISGFPIWQIFITSTVRIVEPIAFTSLFPYVYFMVRDFGIARTEADISKYVGYLASSFSFCQFLSSVQWGMVADAIGRKKVLMIGLSGSTMGMLAFGFATNYWMAISARMLMGFLNGNTGVLRTLIGENCKEKKHQGLLLSTMPFLYQIGSILGPIIGGLLTNASDSTSMNYQVRDSVYYKITAPVLRKTAVTAKGLENLVEKYPYALSNLVIALAFTLSIICCFLFLEETHHELKYKRDYGLDLGDKIRATIGFKPPVRPWHTTILHEVNIRTSLVDREAQNYDTMNEGDSDSNKDSNKSVTMMTSLAPNDDLSSTGELRWRILLRPSILTVVGTQFTMSAHNTVYTEFLPVFLARRTFRESRDSSDLTTPLYSEFPFKIVGGMGFSSVEVGKVLSGTGFCGIFVVAILFPYIDRKFLPVQSFRYLSLIYCVIYLCIPFLVFTLPPNLPFWLTKMCVYALTFTRIILSGTTVPFIVLLIHRASPPEHRAFINGAALSASALSRFFGPLIWGNIMSFAEKMEKGYITWWSLFMLAVLTFLSSFKMHDEEDEEEDEPDDESHFDLLVAEQEEEELEG